MDGGPRPSVRAGPSRRGHPASSLALTSAAARRGRRPQQAAQGSVAEPARARCSRSLRPLSRRDVAVALGACAPGRRAEACPTPSP